MRGLSSQNKNKRRVLMGFDAGKNQNGNFLQRLDRMIGINSRPKSRVSSKVKDMKYAAGEGNRQISNAITVLNNAKYATIKPMSSNIGNDILISSRSSLREAVEG